jgi:hypothetical protein
MAFLLVKLALERQVKVFYGTRTVVGLKAILLGKHALHVGHMTRAVIDNVFLYAKIEANLWTNKRN